jgi:GNAT superfamily N-acetyltransferase
MEITITQVQLAEADALSEFIRSVYDDAVAPHYSEQGNTEFYKYIDTEAVTKHLKTNHWMLKAELDKELAGIIEIRDNNHVSMLFVSSSHQRQGIGKQLLAAAVEKIRQLNPTQEKISVHSSPNSTAAYEKLGFVAISDEKEVNGIRFTTMEKNITH